MVRSSLKVVAAAFFPQGALMSVPIEWVKAVTTIVQTRWSIVFDRFCIFSADENSKCFEYRTTREAFRHLVCGGVDNLAVYSDYRCDDFEDYRAHAFFGVNSGRAVFNISAASGAHCEQLLESLCTELRKVVAATYGFAFTMEQHLEPDEFVVGSRLSSGRMRGTPVSEVESFRVNAELACWRKEYYGERRFLRTCLRDVFPANFISRTHLVAIQDAFRAAGYDFSETSLPLGSLHPIDDYTTIWALEAQVQPKAKAVLLNNGLLICAAR